MTAWFHRGGTARRAPTPDKIFIYSLRHEAQVRRREAADQGKHRRQIRRRQTIPGRQRSGVLFDRSGRNPTPARAGAAVSVIWTTEREIWISAVQSVTKHCAAHD